MRPPFRLRPWVAIALLTTSLSFAASETAGAGPPVGVYPGWTLEGANPSWTGTMTLTGVTNFPSASFVTDSNTPTVSSGASAFLGPGTPFGSAFGSSEGHPYLSPRTAAGTTPSTTTFTFATATPTRGWGFALGDIDADQVTVTATAADGSAVPLAALGWHSAFNYCGPSPIPSSCGGAQSDTPVWDPATATLRGNGVDTSGAAGWFMPTSPIKTLTLLFTPLSGLPTYQIWFAANAVTLSGTVRAPSGAPVPSVPVSLLDAAGTPVPSSAGGVVTTTTGPDGTFAFSGVVAGTYVVAVTPPGGFEAGARTVDATAGDVEAIDFQLVPVVPPAPPASGIIAVTPRFTG